MAVARDTRFPLAKSHSRRQQQTSVLNAVSAVDRERRSRRGLNSRTSSSDLESNPVAFGPLAALQ